VLLSIDKCDPYNNCLDSDETRYKWFIEIAGVDDRKGVRCDVQAWFDMNMQKELAKLNRGDEVAIEERLSSRDIRPRRIEASM